MSDRCSPNRDVKVDLPAPFAGDGSQSFLSWVRQLEVAVSATAGGSRSCSDELVSILPLASASRLFCCGTAFPLQSKQIMLLLKRDLEWRLDRDS